MNIQLDKLPAGSEKSLRQFLLLCESHAINPDSEEDLEYFAKKFIRSLRRQGGA